MELIQNILAIWGLISMLVGILSFFANSYEYSADVKILSSYAEEEAEKLNCYFEFTEENEKYDKTLFVACDNHIKNIVLYKYDLEKEKWKRSEIVSKLIETNTGILFKLDRGEAVPFYKITWQSLYGKRGEYIFSYNGFSGNSNNYRTCYHINIITKVRKILGIK